MGRLFQLVILGRRNTPNDFAVGMYVTADGNNAHLRRNNGSKG